MLELALHIERQLKRVLYRLGYHLTPVRPLDLRSVTDNPIEAAQMAGRQGFVIDVPLADCRGALGFAYTKETLQPFVRTVTAYLAGEALDYEDSPLREYYETVQPMNAWEVLGLAGEPNPVLLKCPPFAFVLPWESVSPEGKSISRPASLRRENIKRGADLAVNHGDGFGPVTLQKGKLEFQALARLADSIRSRGYIRNNGNDGDISGVLLLNNEKARYLVRRGKHRIAVLTALGHERIPIRISFKPPLRSTEACHWLHVRDGLFTCEQALSLFERIFNGRPPKTAIPPRWLEREKSVDQPTI